MVPWLTVVDRQWRARPLPATKVRFRMHLHALRQRRSVRLALASLLAALSLSVVLHHSGLEMGGHAGHGDHGTAASMCIGMAVGAVAVEGLLLIRRSRRNGSRGRRRPTSRRRLVAAALPATGRPIARAGPPLHLQLCVIRR